MDTQARLDAFADAATLALNPADMNPGYAQFWGGWAVHTILHGGPHPLLRDVREAARYAFRAVPALRAHPELSKEDSE